MDMIRRWKVVDIASHQLPLEGILNELEDAGYTIYAIHDYKVVAHRDEPKRRKPFVSSVAGMQAVKQDS